MKEHTTSMINHSNEALTKCSKHVQERVHELALNAVEQMGEITGLATQMSRAANKVAVEKAKFQFASALQDEHFEYLASIAERKADLARRLQSLEGPSKQLAEQQIGGLTEMENQVLERALQSERMLSIAAEQIPVKRDPKGRFQKRNGEVKLSA